MSAPPAESSTYVRVEVKDMLFCSASWRVVDGHPKRQYVDSLILAQTCQVRGWPCQKIG